MSIEKKPVYGPDDVAGSLPERLGEPGRYPFTRGIHQTMHRGRLWTMRQFSGFGTAADTNERTIPAPRARSASAAWRSPALWTWRTCSAASRSTRSRRR